MRWVQVVAARQFNPWLFVESIIMLVNWSRVWFQPQVCSSGLVALMMWWHTVHCQVFSSSAKSWTNMGWRIRVSPNFSSLNPILQQLYLKFADLLHHYFYTGSTAKVKIRLQCIIHLGEDGKWPLPSWIEIKRETEREKREIFFWWGCNSSGPNHKARRTVPS